MSQPSDAQCGHDGQFTNTRWPMVLAAGRQPDSKDGSAALDWLCERYWYPLYAFARRWGRTPEDAADSTQEFFARLVAKVKLAKADPARGRFRSFLLTCFKNHLCEEDAERKRVRSGGSYAHVSFDSMTAEERYRHEPTDQRTPEARYLENWRTALLSNAMKSLEEEYSRLGKTRVFQLLQPCLDGKDPDYAAAAGELGETVGHVRVMAHRLRTRFSERFKAEVAETVTNKSELEAELRDLLSPAGG